MSEVKRTPGPWCIRGQNTAFHEKQFRHLYSVLSPATPAGKAFSRVAENCTEDDAKLIAVALETAAERDRLKAINAELVELLKDATMRLAQSHCAALYDVAIAKAEEIR